MTPVNERNIERLKKLRDPFKPAQIGKLPKPVKKDDPDKGRCVQGSKYSADGAFCGGWHSRSVHLDFVGHAALTDRFLDVDPFWTWEPLSVGPDGLPVLDRNGGMWIRLTICDVTRLGYGDASGKTGANAVKETIGDALRNAGMRFGAALDLWHKGDLHDQEQEPQHAPKGPRPVVTAPLPQPDEPAAVDVATWKAAIAAATNANELRKVGEAIGTLTLSRLEEADLRNLWKDRNAELSQVPEPPVVEQEEVLPL